MTALGMSTSQINLIFVALMGVLFLIDVLTYFGKSHRDFKSVIVSIGVLGTFVGVFIGLLQFNTEDIRASVPNLLEGMKTAFLTSVVGMGLSVVLNIFQRLLPKAATDSSGALQEISAKLDQLADVTALQQQAIERQKHQHDALQEQLTSQFEQTRVILQQSVEAMSRDATQEIVNALSTVVHQFNSQLTEQFGDNFKALNQAVGKLVEWQTQYRDGVEQDRALLAQMRESLDTSQQALSQITSSQTQAQDLYKELNQLLDGASGKSEQLNQQLSHYQALGEKALATFDEVKTGLEQTRSGLESQSKTVHRMTQEISRQLPASLGALEDTLSGLTGQFAKDYESFLNQYKQLVNR